MNKRFLFYSLSALCLIFTLSTAVFAATPIAISTFVGTQKGYNRLVAEFDNDPLKITKIPPGKYNRTTVELAILIKALRLGGLNNDIQFIFVPNCQRDIKEVALGNAVVCGQQLNKGILNKKEFAECLYMSEPITRFGEFQKAIYHLPENIKLENVTTAEELNKAGIGIIGMHWNNDRRVLNQMGITNILTAPTVPLIGKMLLAGRADWIPLHLNAKPDMIRRLEGHDFVPIKGIKFSLLESRHFFVSKRNPIGQQVFTALQTGLRQLRKEGFIRDSLCAAGFFSPQMDSWKMLNAEQYEKGLQN